MISLWGPKKVQYFRAVLVVELYSIVYSSDTPEIICCLPKLKVVQQFLEILYFKYHYVLLFVTAMYQGWK